MVLSISAGTCPICSKDTQIYDDPKESEYHEYCESCGYYYGYDENGLIDPEQNVINVE